MTEPDDSDKIRKMSETEKDELIDAQKQIIGILFEVIKRLQTNNDLGRELSRDGKTSS